MKIVFVDIPMKSDLQAFRYNVNDNPTFDYDGEVIFPINIALAKAMKKTEKIKVILLAKVDIGGNSAVNVGKYQKELNDINRSIGADIEYITLSSPFIETRDIHEALLQNMINKLEDGAEIFADITFGPKSLPIITFAVLNFAEKFFGAHIKNIVYGKVDFIDDNAGGAAKAVNPVMYDLISLYYLNSLTNTMEYKSSADAVKALSTLLSL